MAKKSTLVEFIEKGNIVHDNGYDYIKSVYVNCQTKLIITCRLHGDFLQKPSDHISGKCGCPLCDPTNTLGNEKFIEKSNKKHDNLYDYTRVNYIKNDIPVEIICKEHGSFFQKPGPHLRGQGCPNCYTNNKKSNTKEFTEKSNIVHDYGYDYTLVEYVNKNEKVKIICHSHGIFEQKPSIHLTGHGCKICRCSKLELYLRKKLISNNIDFIPDFRFNDCRNVLPLPFDFYLSSLNILIECDGVQHHKPLEYFGGLERFEYQQKNDAIKTNYCLDTGIKLFRVCSYVEIDALFPFK